MNLSRVTGKIIATQKDAGLSGLKLVVVQHLKIGDLTPGAGYLIAVDSVGADEGDIVIVVTGSSARIAESMKDRPVDATIIGIVDEVEIEGRAAYRKREPAAAR